MITCKNPIMPGFYPDPSICRVGDKYYLVNSTFSYFPGVPIFESEDLAHWKQIGNILDRKEQLPLEGVRHSQGIFAPTIRYHDGTWYMITTNISHRGNFIVTAKNPEGPWSDPIYFGAEASGIDPSLYFDEDGSCYYIGTRESVEPKYYGDWEIWIQELDLQTMKFKGPAPKVWKGSQIDVVWPEGPHLYKKDGYYYILHAEGGTGDHHCICVARSKSIFGPYENNPRNPIITHRHLGKDYPVTNVGHGDLVDTPEGNWYMVLLASRPCEGYSNLGRETFLAKVQWEDGWPVVNPGIGQLEDTFELPGESKEEDGLLYEKHYTFDKPYIPLELLYLRNPDKSKISLSDHPGFLRLYCAKERIGELVSPAFVAVRQKHFHYTVSSKFRFSGKESGEETGLVIMQSDEFYISFTVIFKDGSYVLQVLRQAGDDKKILYERDMEVGTEHLKIVNRGQRADFMFEENGEWKSAVKGVDVHQLSTEVAGGFVGCTIGMYATANGGESYNYVDFEEFTYAEIAVLD